VSWARRLAHAFGAVVAIALNFAALFVPVWLVRETGSLWYLLMYLGSAVLWGFIYLICESMEDFVE
jgi:predicted tellurium resistance membrane protein TerC